MGQCSTLPQAAEANREYSGPNSPQQHQQQPHHPMDQRQQQAFAYQQHQKQKPDPAMITNDGLQVHTQQQQQHPPVTQFSHMNMHSPRPPFPPSRQERQASNSFHRFSPSMEKREGLPQPPECAVRTRCYKLNLESDFVGVAADDPTSHILGPFEGAPPPLTYSASDESTIGSGGTDPTSVAIRTAQIFRGITISNDGTILSQNARATRSNRQKGTTGTKKGEKSRQAAKIDKAKDLVEESIATGLAPGTTDKANMVSLVIIGEYDEMKCLVKDGAKKLRDADGLPDQALLAVNRRRGNKNIISPSRKRVSPYQFPTSSPSHRGGDRGSMSTANNDKREHRQAPNSANSNGTVPPPKLKSNPRDTRSSWREDRKNRRNGGGLGLNPMLHDPCSNMFPPQDSDWSNALGLSRGFNSIWNCGQGGNNSGTMSPVPGNEGATTAKTNHHVKSAKYATATAAAAAAAPQGVYSPSPQQPAHLPQRQQHQHPQQQQHHQSQSPARHSQPYEARNDTDVYHPNRIMTSSNHHADRLDHRHQVRA